MGGTADGGDRAPARGEPTVLVTGATGLVGSHAAALFRERGWRIRALVRPGSRTRFLESLGAELVLGDVTAPDSFSGAAEGCRVVLHGAAHLGSRAPWERFRRVNVEGTRHVLSECMRAGCDRFVHLSSVAVYGPPSAQPRLPVDESSPTDTPLGRRDHYERSKRMAETAVRRAAGDVVEWAVLRPAVVMGERDRHFTPRVARVAERRLLPTVGPGDNRLPVVYAGNVAEACWLAATRPEAAGGVYNVADDGGLTQRELLAEAAPPGARIVPLPRGPVEWTARAAEWASDLLPGDASRMLSVRRVWFLGHDNPFSSGRIRSELDWRPSTPPLEGWSRALEWRRHRASSGS